MYKMIKKIKISNLLRVPHFTSCEKGISILEILLGLGMFAIIASAVSSLSIGGYRSLIRAERYIDATNVAQVGTEASRFIRDVALNNLIYDRSAVAISSSTWTLSGDDTTEQIGYFSRIIDFYDVCRNASDNIADCPADYIDPHTKKVVVDVEWDVIKDFATTSLQYAAYLTNWESRDWVQTDWFGGDGQSVWSDTTEFLDNSDGNIYYDDSGEIKLYVATEGGGWFPSGGFEITDTSDTDFNAGILNNTQVLRSGSDAASVALDDGYVWSGHVDSQSVTIEDLRSISIVAANDIWAVGDSGIFLHYNGSNWIESTNTITSNVHAIDMVNTTYGWAVGGSKKIWRYDGVNWTEQEDFGPRIFYTIDILNANYGWIAGNKGGVFKWDGNWLESPGLGNNVTLRGVDIIDLNDGWIVGENGEIYHYDGADWNSFAPSPTINDIYAIDMISSSDGWIVGENGEIYHYDGVDWSPISSPTINDIYAIDMMSSSDGWIVGKNGEIYYYDGADWNPFVPSPTTNDLNSVAMISQNEGWSLGENGTILNYALAYYNTGTFLSRVFDGVITDPSWDIIYWQENLPLASNITLSTRTGSTPTPDASWTGWSAEMTNEVSSQIPPAQKNNQYLQYRATLTRGTDPLATPELDYVTVTYSGVTSFVLNDIDAINANDVWAVGNTGKVAHYDGNDWSLFIELGGPNILGVDAVDANNIWAVGQTGSVYHYDGVSWSTQSTGGDTWHAVDMVSTNDGWIGGNSGKIWHYNGVTWSEFDLGNRDINDIYMVSVNDGWAVGDNGEIYHYDGANWTQEPDTGGMNWYGIHMIDASDGFIVGSGGNVRKYNGFNWDNDLSTPPGTSDLNDVYALASDDAIAVGDNGTILNWDGVSWTEVDNPNTDDLYGVDMVSSLVGWASGFKGVVAIYREAGDIVPSTGVLISSAFNMWNSSPVQIVEWDEYIPPECSPISACNVQIQVRVAPDALGSPGAWTDWYGPDGPGTYFTNSSGEIVPNELNWNQWVQYKATLNSDEVETPIVYEIRVNYK